MDEKPESSFAGKLGWLLVPPTIANVAGGLFLLAIVALVSAIVVRVSDPEPSSGSPTPVDISRAVVEGSQPTPGVTATLTLTPTAAASTTVPPSIATSVAPTLPVATQAPQSGGSSGGNLVTSTVASTATAIPTFTPTPVADPFEPCPSESTAASQIGTSVARFGDGDESKASTCAFRFDTGDANAPVTTRCLAKWQCSWIEWSANTTVVVQNGAGQSRQTVSGTFRFTPFYQPAAEVHDICSVFRSQIAWDKAHPQTPPMLHRYFSALPVDPIAC